MAIDSKADDSSSPSWLQLNGNLSDGRETVVFLPTGAGDDEKVTVSISFRTTAATHGQESGQRIIKRAYDLIGTPYKWGGMSLSKGFDCSGLLVYLFRSEVGLELPRTTKSMVSEDYLHVSRHELKPGDAVFFAIDDRGQANHVGLYVGNNEFIHAPRTGKNIRVDSLKNNYWSERYHGARRFHHKS